MNIIFYHANCCDGFAAAFAAWRKFGIDGAAYMPMSYGRPVPNLPEIAGTDPGPHSVFIVDFSWPAADLLALADRAEVASVVVLDHHASAQRHLDGLSHPKMMVHFSTSRSGAVMAWRYFQDRQRDFFDREPLPERYWDEDEAPEMILHVEDYDIHWPPLMKDTRKIQAGLWRGQERCFHRWQRLLMDWSAIGTPVCLSAGEAILRSDALTLDRLAGICTREFGPDGELALAVNSPVLPNEIAERLLAEHPLAEYVFVYYRMAEDRWKFSLRSRPGGYDVSRLAEQHGGGGHQSSASFISQKTIL